MGWGRFGDLVMDFCLVLCDLCCVICAVFDGVCVRGTILPGGNPAEGSHDPDPLAVTGDVNY